MDKLVITIRAGESLPAQVDWAAVDRVSVAGTYLTPEMPAFLAEALRNKVGLHIPDPELQRVIDRLSL